MNFWHSLKQFYIFYFIIKKLKYNIHINFSINYIISTSLLSSAAFVTLTKRIYLFAFTSKEFFNYFILFFQKQKFI
jgi:hypothetical protein